MDIIKAFVARSFAKQDETKIRPIIEHLDTFRSLGFIHDSAEPSEADRVSDKVQRKIDDCDIFIGILTQRHAIYSFDQGIKSAVRMAMCRLSPQSWSPPPWVLQECGYALKAGKKLILYVEPGVENPTLHGDLEYIPYNYENPTDAFHHSSEMINKIISGQRGFTVTTVISESLAVVEPEAKQLPDNTSHQLLASESGSESLFYKMRDSLLELNFPQAEEAYSAGIEAIRNGQLNTDEVTWQCVYHIMRFRAGDNSSFEKLKAIEDIHPGDPIPIAQVGQCLMKFREYRTAADRFIKAASLGGEHYIDYILRAVEALKELKEFVEAEALLRSAIDSNADKIPDKILAALYDVLKSSDKMPFACGIAELSLQHAPQNSTLRYSLGLDYHSSKQNELFLYHYDLLCSVPKPEAGSLHNYALACSQCDLQIASVRNYKNAIEAGETLSSSNLAAIYLESGFIDEAKTILKDAMLRDDYVPEVPRTLANLTERDHSEHEKLQSILAKGKEQQTIFYDLGSAYIRSISSDISGVWTFPFGDISLKLEGKDLFGEVTVQKTDHLLLAMLRASSQSHELDTKLATKTHHYKIKGELTGCVCKAALLHEQDDSKSTLVTSNTDTTDCYITFSNDAHNGAFYKIEDGSIKKQYAITKCI